MKVLMVCLGNICRSPLAEGILQHKINEHQLNWIVDSAGTSHYHVGEAPHHLSQKVALQNGINISQQQCRQFVAEDMIRFDKIYVMDANNYNEVKRISAKHFNAAKVDFLLNELYPLQNQEVPDPWYGTEQDYYTVFDMINKACDKIVQSHKK